MEIHMWQMNLWEKKSTRCRIPKKDILSRRSCLPLDVAEYQTSKMNEGLKSELPSIDDLENTLEKWNRLCPPLKGVTCVNSPSTAIWSLMVATATVPIDWKLQFWNKIWLIKIHTHQYLPLTIGNCGHCVEHIPAHPTRSAPPSPYHPTGVLHSCTAQYRTTGD